MNRCRVHCIESHGCLHHFHTVHTLCRRRRVGGGCMCMTERKRFAWHPFRFVSLGWNDLHVRVHVCLRWKNLTQLITKRCTSMIFKVYFSCRVASSIRYRCYLMEYVSKLISRGYFCCQCKVYSCRKRVGSIRTHPIGMKGCRQCSCDISRNLKHCIAVGVWHALQSESGM